MTALFTEGGHDLLSLFYILRAMGMTVLAGVFPYTLLNSWLNKHHTQLTMAAWIAAVIIVNFLLAALLGGKPYMRLTPLLLNLPVFVLFGWLSHHRDGRVLSTLMTLMVENALVMLAGMLCTLSFYDNPGVDLLECCAAAGLLIALNLHLRRLYLDMQEALCRDWFLFSTVPLAYHASLHVYAMQVSPGERTGNLVDILVTSAMVIAAYMVIFFFFQDTRRNAQIEWEYQSLQTQVSALRRQQGIVARSKEKIRLYRHDMRFTLHTLAAMLERGNTAGALEYLGKSNAKLDGATLNHYCKNPVLDTLLAYYEELAQDRDIQVQIRMTLGPELPMDGTELSTVFANALENAIHACEKLPEGTPRRIEVTAVSTPDFCAEIANTCDGKAAFDDKGFPIIHEPDHGTDTHSIVAFFSKYKVIYQYHVTEDNMFRLRFLIDRSHSQDETHVSKPLS